MDVKANMAGMGKSVDFVGKGTYEFANGEFLTTISELKPTNAPPEVKAILEQVVSGMVGVKQGGKVTWTDDNKFTVEGSGDKQEFVRKQ